MYIEYIYVIVLKRDADTAISDSMPQKVLNTLVGKGQKADVNGLLHIEV